LLFRSFHDSIAKEKMASTYKAVDSKKEEFRKYLEKTGVLDTLTKILVSLYEEPDKPNNPLDFLRKHVTHSDPLNDIELLKCEIEMLHNELDQLKEENEQLKKRLSNYQDSSELNATLD